MIYYLNWYNGKSKYTRSKNPAASTKILYIAKAIKESGKEISILSCAQAETNSGKLFCNREVVEDEGINVIYAPCVATKIVLLRKIGSFFKKIWLLIFLLKNLKSEDFLLVYHSPFYCKLIPFIKKCKIVLEVEEIYADVSGDKRLRKKELHICDKADAFLFPTEMLRDVVNPKNKPYLLIHGTYMVEADRENIFDDGKIHVVYAGTFDPRKGGGMAAKVAEFLDERYHVHILGFGNEKQIEDLKNEIEKISALNKGKATYDGCLSGAEYLNFIHSCDIGLSTQNPDADFNATSFPSKILSYMSNGLRVVSVNIPAIKNSAVGDYLYYYEGQTPQEIAKTIMNIDMNDGYNGKQLISELDKKFSCEIIKFLKDLENV